MREKTYTYTYPNPCWLADTFIYRKKNLKGIETTIFVKINSRRKIEEIGVDVIKRCHGCQKKEWIKEASPLQKSILNRIGDEFWCRIIDREMLTEQDDWIKKNF